MTQWNDEATMNVSSDPGQVTVEDILDHAIYATCKGPPLIGFFNDTVNSRLDWEVLDYSDNLAGINFEWGDNRFVADSIPESLAYQEFWIDYMRRTTPESGITARITDEFDRYQTTLIITYEYVENSQTYQNTVQLETPNSVFKHLMGVPQEDPIAYQPSYSIIPGQPLFDPFFQNLYQLLTDQDYELMESMMRNRNTSYPLRSRDNPFDDTLSLLEQIADTSEPDIYPIGVRYDVVDHLD